MTKYTKSTITYFLAGVGAVYLLCGCVDFVFKLLGVG